MTSYHEGYCRLCGEYSQGVWIDSPGICAACAAKYGYPKSWNELRLRKVGTLEGVSKEDEIMNLYLWKIRKVRQEWEVRRTGKNWHIHLGKGLFRQFFRCLMFSSVRG